MFDYIKRRSEDMERVSHEKVEQLINDSEVHTVSMHNRCTVVSVKLPNGFIITESSTSLNEDDYDMYLGKAICLERIKSRLFELEAYGECHQTYYENTKAYRHGYRQWLMNRMSHKR